MKAKLIVLAVFLVVLFSCSFPSYKTFEYEALLVPAENTNLYYKTSFSGGWTVINNIKETYYSVSWRTEDDPVHFYFVVENAERAKINVYILPQRELIVSSFGNEIDFVY